MRSVVGLAGRELGVRVASPALDRTALHERADRAMARRDLHGVALEGGGGREERGVETDDAGAETALRVVAAALDGAVGHACARDLVADGDLLRPSLAGD